MYKVTTILFVLLLLVSCKQEAKQETPKVTNQETVTAKSTKEQNAMTKAQASDAIEKLEAAIEAFMECKKNAENRTDCRNSISKLISEFYNISDFKNSDGDYVIYDSIQPIVKNGNWTRIGNAADQAVLESAQQLANSGKATIAIDETETYGQVAMIIPGKLTNSGSWKLKVPNTVVLVNYDAERSFHNKALSYAFKSTDGVVLYSKN